MRLSWLLFWQSDPQLHIQCFRDTLLCGVSSACLKVILYSALNGRKQSAQLCDLDLLNSALWQYDPMMHLMVGCSPKSDWQVSVCGLSCNVTALLASPPPSTPLPSLWLFALLPPRFHRIQMQQDYSRCKSSYKKEPARPKLGQVWIINFFSCEVLGFSYAIISIIHLLCKNTRTCSNSSAFLKCATGNGSEPFNLKKKCLHVKKHPP